MYLEKKIYILRSVVSIEFHICSFHSSLSFVSILRRRFAPDTRYGARACAPRPWKCRSEIDVRRNCEMISDTFCAKAAKGKANAAPALKVTAMLQCFDIHQMH